MTYKDHFVVEVKHNGKFLRVRNDVVTLPFGSEYSLFFKNLDTRRVSVNISIDGQDVLDNSSLVIDGNSSTEIEGFLKGSVAKNRFKFIQKTKEIQDYRGDRADDGLIRVEFAYEKPPVKVLTEVHHHYHWNYRNWFTGNSGDRYRGINPGCVDTFTYASNNSFSCNDTPVGVESVYNVNNTEPLQDEGITVKGSECNQQFVNVTMGELEPPTVIVINLKGVTENKKIVQKPVMVKTKLKCSTCGRVSKSYFKFCPNCGTFLE